MLTLCIHGPAASRGLFFIIVEIITIVISAIIIVGAPQVVGILEQTYGRKISHIISEGLPEPPSFVIFAPAPSTISILSKQALTNH
jgi:hypothetical protein